MSHPYSSGNSGASASPHKAEFSLPTHLIPLALMSASAGHRVDSPVIREDSELVDLDFSHHKHMASGMHHSTHGASHGAGPSSGKLPYAGHASASVLQPTLHHYCFGESPVKSNHVPYPDGIGPAVGPLRTHGNYDPGHHDKGLYTNGHEHMNGAPALAHLNNNIYSPHHASRANAPPLLPMPKTLLHHKSTPDFRPNQPMQQHHQQQHRQVQRQTQHAQPPQNQIYNQSHNLNQNYNQNRNQHQYQSQQGPDRFSHQQAPQGYNYGQPPNQHQPQQRPMQYLQDARTLPQQQPYSHAGASPNLYGGAPIGYPPENRHVVTSPSMPIYNADAFHIQRLRKDRDPRGDVRTKSLTTSHQPMMNNNNNNTNNCSPAVSGLRASSAGGSGYTFSLSSKSLSSLGKLSSLSTKKFSGPGGLHKDRTVLQKERTVLQKERTVLQTTLASVKSSANMAAGPRKPAVNPAFLSLVAKAFKEGMLLTINMKDGLEYHDSFTGKNAIDLICSIIRTSDRNLALLLVRALDAQKFFHDATYNHRLRDSANEVYNFTRVYSDVEFFDENSNSNRASSVFTSSAPSTATTPYPLLNYPPSAGSPIEGNQGSFKSLDKTGEKFEKTERLEKSFSELSGVNGVFTILTDCYLPTCSRSRLCYSIACPRRLEQQARLNMKPRGGLRRAVLRLSLHDAEASKTLWHETVDADILATLDKHEKMRQELIYELIYTERDYVKDLEFMTDFYILPLRNLVNNIIPERERDAFIRTVFGGVGDLLRLAKSLSEALTARQQLQKPVVENVGDVLLLFVGSFEPFIKYSGNKVFASFEHERQQQVNLKYARFLEAIEKKPESRKQDFLSFLIKGVQRPARYQLLVSGILKNTSEESPDHKNLVKAKEEIEKVLVNINIQTGEATDRHKIMVLHRLLGRQTLEDRFNFKLNYTHRIIYQVTLSRKRDNEKIDLYLFEHALLMVKHKIQNKREVHKVFERPVYLPLLFMNSGYETPTFKTLLPFREEGSLVSDNGAVGTAYSAGSAPQPQKMQLNFFCLGSNPVHVSLFADDLTNQNQVLLQVQLQQRKLIAKHDVFLISKYETRRFSGNNRINCAVPCYGGKKLMYGTDSGVWVSTVRSISVNSLEKICSDPTMVISKPYVTQLEVLVEYSKVLVLSDKTLYEFDLSCTDSLDHVKNTRLGKIILTHIAFFRTGVCDGRLLLCAVKSGSARAINIVEPTNPFDKNKNKNKRLEVREITFASDPVLISFFKTKLCIGCMKGFEILSLEAGRKESILDEADPSLDFATQRESVTPLAIHRLDKNFLLSYSEFSFFINKNGWRTKHDWGIFWEGTPQNIALFYPYLLAFDPGFIEIRDLESTVLIRALVGENIRYLHSNEHEALYACEENGYDIIVSVDFLNLKPKQTAPAK